MTDKPTLWMLVGLPGTGKSTWRHTQIGRNPRPTGLVSSDDLIEGAAKGAGLSYREMFDLIDWKVMRARLLAKTAAMVKERLDIIVDRMNMTEATRDAFLELARGYRRVAVICDAPVEHLVATNKAREPLGRNIPGHAFNKAIRDYERPSRREGFHQVQVHTPLGPGPLTTHPRHPPFQTIQF